MSDVLSSADLRGEVSAFDLIAKTWIRKRTVLVFGILGLLLGIAKLHMSTPLYTAELKVTSAQSTGEGAISALDGLSSLAALGGFSMGTSSATPLDLYLDAYESREVATKLAADSRILRTIFSAEWNENTKTWQRPSSSLDGIFKLLARLFGLQEYRWQQPDGARLQAYLSDHVNITRDPKDPIVTISFKHPDPDFAIYLLSKLNAVADQHVRASALMRAEGYVRYLTTKLQTVTVAEYRNAISQILSDQEKAIMIASSDAPYAVSVVQKPAASNQPTEPKGVTTLVLSLIAGIFIGVLWVLADVSAFISRLRANA